MIQSVAATSHSHAQRLLPEVLFQLGESSPNRLYATIPYSSTLADGFREVTFGRAAATVKSLREWISDTVGSPSENFETLAYLGIPDLRGAFIFLAAVSLGYKVSPSFPTMLSANRGSSFFLHLEMRWIQMRPCSSKQDAARLCLRWRSNLWSTNYARQRQLSVLKLHRWMRYWL